MIIVKAPQGTPEWHQARAGVITASMFSTAREWVDGLTDQQRIYVKAIREGHSADAAAAMAEYKAKPKPSEKLERAIAGLPVGDFSDAAKRYAYRLAIERIGGAPLDEGFETWSMQRGHELEPEARGEHERVSGLMVMPAGFILTDDNVFGASADGLIDDESGAEYKCLIDPGRLRKVMLDDDISEFTDQIQGCMWITGRKEWHFCLYCPILRPVGLHLYWRRVQRDEQHIEAMEADLLRFKALTDSYEARMRKVKPYPDQ